MNSQEIWSFVRTILNLVGGIMVTNHLASAPDVAQASTDLMTIGPALMSLISIGVGVYSHWNMKKVPENSVAIAGDQVIGLTAKGKSIAVRSPIQTVVGALFAALFVFHADDACAQKAKAPVNLDPLNIFTSKTSSTSQALSSFDSALQAFGSKVQAVEKDLADKVIADLNAAIADATLHNDLVSLPCWQANLAFVQALPAEWATPPQQPIGIALQIQIARDLLSAITSSDAKSIKVACAALYGDQLAQIGQLGLLFGFSL